MKFRKKDMFIKNIISFSLKNKLFIFFATTALIIAGVFSYIKTPIEAFPDVTNTQITIITQWPGRSAEEIEKFVTVPIEIAMNSVPKKTDVRSTTLFGLSVVKVIFEDNVDDAFARPWVNNLLAEVDLPDGVKPGIEPPYGPTGEIYRYTIRSKSRNVKDLKTLQDWVIERQLRSVSGVADVVSFGVAPSVVTYLWILRDIPNRGVGWLVVLVYISCAALRLARFNVQSIGTQPGSYCDKNLDLNKSDDEIVVERPINIPIIKSYRDRYGTGVLMPAAAALCLTPMIMSFEWLREYRFNPYVIAVYVLFVGILMISTVPTFLIKNIGVEHRHIKPILLLCAAIIAGLLLEPWLIIPPLSLCYLLSMPIIMVKVRNMRGNR